MEKQTTLVNIATEINKEHELCERAIKHGLEHAVKCGELLNEAKAKVQRGQWLSWLESNCSFSVRTAQTYMRVAANAQRVAHLSLREAVKAIAEPKYHEDLSWINSKDISYHEKIRRLEILQSIQKKQIKIFRKYLDEIDTNDPNPDIIHKINDLISEAQHWQNMCSETKIRCEREMGKIIQNAFKT